MIPGRRRQPRARRGLFCMWLISTKYRGDERMADDVQAAPSLAQQNGARHDAPMRALPDNLAVKCPNCRELLLGKDWEKNLKVCSRCGHHFRLSAPDRIEML